MSDSIPCVDNSWVYQVDTCDVIMRICIKDWKAKDNREEFQWTRDDFSLKGSYIDYSLKDDELLLCVEVECFRDALGKLLEGKIEEDCDLSFVEPDWAFSLLPAKRLFSIPGKISYRDGYCDVDISLKMEVRFWCSGGLGSNSFLMVFERDVIDSLFTYLQFVTGQISETNQKVKRLLELGVIQPA